MRSPSFGLTDFLAQDSRRQTALGLSQVGAEMQRNLDQLQTALATFCDTKVRDATKKLSSCHFVATGVVQVQSIT
jgi:hypothetical protein